ncbi:MAG: hypothetical protein ACKOYM_00895 [Actinomycetes bacterium]
MTTERPTAPPAPDGRRVTKRRHKAQTSRIAVAGASTTAMFGIVAALGHASAAATEASAPPVQPPSSAPVSVTSPAPVVVVRRIPVYVPRSAPMPTAARTPVTQRTYQAPVAPKPVARVPVTRTRGS